MTKLNKAKWLRKLARARYFVVLTDRESVISLEGVNPRDLNDYIALGAQTAALEDFHSKLGELVKQHQRSVTQLANKRTGRLPVRSERVTSTNGKPTVSRNTKVKKIKVIQK